MRSTPVFRPALGRLTLVTTVGLIACALPPAGCGRRSSEQQAQPNIIWVVWDTVRRDRLSLYGHEVKTTPFLDEWAQGARVFTNCVSPASTTAPAHASMFTGLLPSEHGASNAHPQLDERFTTIAELLRDQGGYDTYLFSANPHIVAKGKFTQGFDRAEHPWSPKHVQRAREIVTAKIDPQDRSCELAAKINQTRGRAPLSEWNIKTAGALAQQGVTEWLDARTDREKPFFVFLNYMEAHRPLIPSRKYREQMLTPEQLVKSFKIDRRWPKTWAYVMRAAEYTDEEIELTRKTYDACLLELDDLFRSLIQTLEQRGELDNTIVILTADHGEHLGEHHMLDHQFSLYNELLYVPLIVRYPQAFAAGVDDGPAMSFDLFPTLLNLAQVAMPADLHTRAVDLRELPDRRLRMAEYPMWTDGPFQGVKVQNPSFDPAPWQRKLRVLYQEPYKLICGSNGTVELYNVIEDRLEQRNLFETQPAALLATHEKLVDLLHTLRPAGELEARQAKTPEEIQQLGNLGYVGDQDGAQFVGVEDYCRCAENDGDEEAAGDEETAGG